MLTMDMVVWTEFDSASGHLNQSYHPSRSDLQQSFLQDAWLQLVFRQGIPSVVRDSLSLAWQGPHFTQNIVSLPWPSLGPACEALNSNP
jgi:hypothetical protein